MKTFRTRAQWEALIKEQKESGVSVNAFCTGKGIHPVTFYKKRKEMTHKSEFVQLPVNSEKRGRIIIKIKDISIEPETGHDPQELSSVIRTVLEAVYASI